ncbi:MAG: hypothetical protein ACREO8_12565, partial [Luteimonas sp.]
MSIDALACTDYQRTHSGTWIICIGAPEKLGMFRALHTIRLQSWFFLAVLPLVGAPEPRPEV